MAEIRAPEEVFEDVDEGVEGLLETWLVEEGEQVAADQPVADAVVVKTSFQLYAPCDGTVASIVVPQGNTFGPGAVLATIEEGAGAAEVEPAVAETRAERVPLTGMRGAVAREMAAAWQAPRVAIGVEVDMTAAQEAVEAQSLSPTHAVLRAVALTLREHPRVNARLTEDAVELSDEVNIGLAVNLDEGVIVPVIREADTKSMAELATEARDLAQAARDETLPGTALRDGTFTVSNLGATGIDWFTPILNRPEVAILGMGRVTHRVVAKDGVPTVAPTMDLTLVFDHRALDGHPAALFLAAVRDRLERATL